ncbi:MAG: hypothetical protein Q9184_006091 [Pyrenodesmia sp. 2 TL-2023]
METYDFHRALTDIKSLLQSRERLVDSEVAIVGLDRIIFARVSSLLHRTTTLNVEDNGVVLLSEITQIRQQMETARFNLARVDDLAAKVYEEGHIWSSNPAFSYLVIRYIRFTERTFLWGSRQTSKFELRDSLTGTYATEELLEVRLDSITQINWSPRSKRIQINYWHHGKGGRRQLFIEMGRDEDAYRLLGKLKSDARCMICTVHDDEMEDSLRNRALN